jgi:hypothetical protein
MEIEERVLLLAIFKKHNDEKMQDVLLMLEDSKLFTLKEGKKLLKSLKSRGYLESDTLTVMGVEKAKEVELEFKI